MLRSSDKEDLRYVNEIAILIDQATRASLSREILRKYNADRDPIEMWKMVATRTASDTYRLNALNNIAYYFYMNRNKPDAVAALESWKSM